MVYGLDEILAKRVAFAWCLSSTRLLSRVGSKEHEADNLKHLGRGTECACSVTVGLQQRSEEPHMMVALLGT